MKVDGPVMALRHVWSAYECAWSETDAERRDGIFSQTLDTSFIYSDPVIRTEGYGPLSDYIAQLQSKLPGMRIVTTSFEEHHDICLVKWTMQDGHRNALAQGVTCGEMIASGRLIKAAVFYDLPAQA